MEINGNTYVADDLELRGVGSKVTLKGNYYGYNFQKITELPIRYLRMRISAVL